MSDHVPVIDEDRRYRFEMRPSKDDQSLVHIPTSCMEGRDRRYRFEMRPSKDHDSQVWLNLDQQFQGEDLKRNNNNRPWIPHEGLRPNELKRLNSLDGLISTLYLLSLSSIQDVGICTSD
jgi:hypothetical protein